MTKLRESRSQVDAVQTLQILVAVADLGSLTAAAEHLTLTPSAVSKAVTRAEERLGARLVQRTTRKVAFTDLGQAYVTRGRQVLAELDALEASASAGVRGVVRISAPALFGALVVAPRLAMLQQRHAELDVQLQCDDRRIDIVAERIDIAVRILEKPPAELVARAIGEDRRGLFASPSYLTKIGIPKSTNDLATAMTIAYSGAPKRPWRVGRAAFSTDSVLAAREAAVAGLGIAELPEYLAAVDVAAGRLREVLPGSLRVMRKVFVLYLPSRHLPPHVRACIEALTDAVES